MEHNYEEKLESFSGSRTAFVHWAAAIMLLVTVVAPISTRAQAAATFNYRPDLTARVISKHTTGATAYKVVAFGSGDHLLTAEVVAPAVPTRKIAPGVLFVHWEGDRKTTNHTEFERDAAALSRRGVTSVLLDAHWSTFLTHGHVWFRDIRNFQTDYSEGVTQVIDLRRALDLLISLPGVDSSRVAYVG
nr:hypothetical protein [Candidatus Eremiobacteraeota bacterium]